jgi:hypothetical protein
VNVFTFNYRGIYKSQGSFSFSNVIEDIGAALQYVAGSDNLRSYKIDPENVILGGWSFGGAMVPAGAVHNLGIKRFFMISGRNFGKEARKIEGDQQYAEQVARNLDGLRSPNGPLKASENILTNLIENQDRLDYEKLAPKLIDRDILLIAGWNDDLTTIEEHTLPFYRALRVSGADRVRIEAIQDDHEFAGSKDQIVQILVNWLRKVN